MLKRPLLLRFDPSSVKTSSLVFLQVTVLRGENAVAKSLQSAMETLQKDKAQLQSRVHSLEQRLLGNQASEGDFSDTVLSGEDISVIRVHFSSYMSSKKTTNKDLRARKISVTALETAP